MNLVARSLDIRQDHKIQAQLVAAQDAKADNLDETDAFTETIAAETNTVEDEAAYKKQFSQMNYSMTLQDIQSENNQLLNDLNVARKDFQTLNTEYNTILSDYEQYKATLGGDVNDDSVKNDTKLQSFMTSLMNAKKAKDDAEKKVTEAQNDYNNKTAQNQIEQQNNQIALNNDLANIDQEAKMKKQIIDAKKKMTMAELNHIDTNMDLTIKNLETKLKIVQANEDGYDQSIERFIDRTKLELG